MLIKFQDQSALLGDVLNRAQHLDSLASFRHRKTPDMHPEWCAFRGDHRQFQIKRRTLADCGLDRTAKQGLHRGGKGADPLRQGQRRQRVMFEDEEGLLGPERCARLQIQLPAADTRNFSGAFEQFNRRCQGLAHSILLRDIAEHQNHADDLTACIADRCRAVRYLILAAIACQ